MPALISAADPLSTALAAALAASCSKWASAPLQRLKWRALSAAAAHVSADGEDWSTDHSGSALVAHVRGRVDHYLSPVVVAQVLGEFEALDGALDQALGA